MQAIVELTPSAQTGGVAWELCTSSGCGSGVGPTARFPDLVLPPKQSQDVIFIINNPPGTNITFPADPYDAIFIQPNTKPTTKVYQAAGQLGTPKLSKNKTVLVLKDKNKGQAMDFHYALNFSDGSTIDPVIKNGGGTTEAPRKLPVIGSDPVAALLVGLAIGFALGAVLLRRMAQPRTR